ncbi:hypothetical protein F4604DRAFT_332 [Suillus subluteus]|nr:hypothetical protein F4604DRAFT_332 [Suillus subluteus]
MVQRIIMRILDSITGPKDVRSLLITRGITGFFGLFGVYLSLEHLSVTDARVLIFLTPLTTAVAGSILLKESYPTNQAVAGGEKYSYFYCLLLLIEVSIVRSFFFIFIVLWGRRPYVGHSPFRGGLTPAYQCAVYSVWFS